MIYPILTSLYTWLTNISGLNVYSYYDANLDISETYQCNSKTALPLGTETTFILVNNVTGEDLTGVSDTLINRYILFTTSTFTLAYKRITAYNTLTGQITIDSAFGEAVLTTKVFDVVFLDTLFIDTGSSFQTYRKKTNTEELVPIYLNLQTKDDSTKEKILDYMYLIEADFISKSKRIPIYESAAIKGYMKCYDSINKDSKGNFDNQLQKYLMSFSVRYSQNFKI